ncbi:MAG: ABC transporter ATP-binding protein [Anaerolineales bacterium]|nr:ABC transporter ATP-binding protein [Anaerolineales bacterium]
MENTIEVAGLVKKYPSQKDKNAINHLTLSVPRGQLFGLIGPDGAGKTTTLRILSTVMPLTSGSVTVLGYDLPKQAEDVRPKIGYMPQNFSLYPDLSVIENLNFFADLNQVKGADRQKRIEEMLRFTRLDRFQRRKAANLSGGMKKKLALACALVHSPQVLLLDEPSTGVDPVSRRELWVMLAEVVAGGVTVLVSTPYMDEADRCNQVGIIYQGDLLSLGTPEDLQNALPYTIIEVKARPRKVMRKVVAAMDGVQDWRPVGDRLRLSVLHSNGKIEKTIRTLEKELKDQRAQVQILRTARKTMEDVFTYAVQQGREG